VESINDSSPLFQRSIIPKIHYSESLLFPQTLSLTSRLTLTLILILNLNLNAKVSRVIAHFALKISHISLTQTEWCVSTQWTFGIAGRCRGKFVAPGKFFPPPYSHNITNPNPKGSSINDVTLWGMGNRRIQELKLGEGKVERRRREPSRGAKGCGMWEGGVPLPTGGEVWRGGSAPPQKFFFRSWLC